MNVWRIWRRGAAFYAAKHRGRNAVVEHGLVRPGDAVDAMKMAGEGRCPLVLIF
jgi:hypothetical protein